MQHSCQSDFPHTCDGTGTWIYMDDLTCKDHRPFPLYVCQARAVAIAQTVAVGDPNVLLVPLATVTKTREVWQAIRKPRAR